MKKTFLIAIVAILSIACVFASDTHYGIEADFGYEKTVNNGTVGPDVYWSLSPYFTNGNFSFKAVFDYKGDGFESLIKKKDTTYLDYFNNFFQYIYKLEYEADNLYIGASRDLEIFNNHILTRGLDLANYALVQPNMDYENAVNNNAYYYRDYAPYEALPFLAFYNSEKFALSAYYSDIRVPVYSSTDESRTSLGFIQAEIKAKDVFPVAVDFDLTVLHDDFKMEDGKIEEYTCVYFPEFGVSIPKGSFTFDLGLVADLFLIKTDSLEKSITLDDFYDNYASEFAIEYETENSTVRGAVYLEQYSENYYSDSYGVFGADENNGERMHLYRTGTSYADLTNMGLAFDYKFDTENTDFSVTAVLPLDAFNKNERGYFRVLKNDNTDVLTTEYFNMSFKYNNVVSFLADVNARGVIGFATTYKNDIDAFKLYNDCFDVKLGLGYTSRLLEAAVTFDINEIGKETTDFKVPVTVLFKVKADNFLSE